MNIVKIIFPLFFYVILGINCSGPDNIYQNFDFSVLPQKCKTENKYLIALLGINDCNFCKQLHQIITTSPKLRELIQKKFILTNVDVQAEPLLTQILNTTSVPAILIADSTLTVKYVHTGMLQEAQLLYVLKEIADNKTVLSCIQTSLYSSGRKLYQLYSNVLQAYFLNHKIFLNEEDNTKAITLLKQAVRIEPYFMNQYLLMNAYYGKNERKKAERLKQLLNAEIQIYDQSLYGNIFEKKIVLEEADIPESQKPDLYIENKIVDIGQVQSGQPAEFNIKYTNTGDSPLIITKIDASCGCIKNEWTRKPVKKNETGNIKLNYYSDSPGYISKRVVIYSNARNNPAILIVKGTVK